MIVRPQKGARMKVSRCEAKVAAETDFEAWPVLFDRPIASGEPPYNMMWERVIDGSAPARISLDDAAGDALPQYQYEVELSPEDIGALLWNMPVDVVPAIIGRMLRGGQSEVIGAVVGQVIAYLVERGSGRAE